MQRAQTRSAKRASAGKGSRVARSATNSTAHSMPVPRTSPAEATPSMAAELATPDIGELLGGLASMGGRLRAGLTAQWERARRRLDRAATHPVFQRPQVLLQERQLRVDDAWSAVAGGMERIVERRRARLERAAAALDALNPHAVVGRGYAICRRADGALVRSIHDVRSGDGIAVTVGDGDLIGTVSECLRQEERL